MSPKMLGRVRWMQWAMGDGVCPWYVNIMAGFLPADRSNSATYLPTR
jgi:hypothetical protein